MFFNETFNRHTVANFEETTVFQIHLEIMSITNFTIAETKKEGKEMLHFYSAAPFGMQRKRGTFSLCLLLIFQHC